MDKPTTPALPDAKESGDAPRTRIEAAYLLLRQDIVEGHLAPGDKLRVEHLKDRYGVGAGTLREALSLLVADALVTSEGQRGFRVAPISLADLEDITRNRMLLEPEALRQSVLAGTDDWEAGVIGAFHKLTKTEARLGDRTDPLVREWEERNRCFHEALISACQSYWLRYMIRLLYRQSERYRHLAILNTSRPRDIHAEHQAITDAALARDADKAAESLKQHIWLTFEALRDN